MICNILSIKVHFSLKFVASAQSWFWNYFLGNSRIIAANIITISCYDFRKRFDGKGDEIDLGLNFSPLDSFWFLRCFVNIMIFSLLLKGSPHEIDQILMMTHILSSDSIRRLLFSTHPMDPEFKSENCLDPHEDYP